MTQICVVSTLLGGMTAAAAMESGALANVTGGERLLLVTNPSHSPELVAAWHEAPAARGIVGRFDRIIRLDSDLYPFHPSMWTPRDEDLPLLGRLFRSRWGIGDTDVELVVDALLTPPASALARVFYEAPLTLLSEGLTSYAPVREHQPLHIAQRLGDFLYLDVIEGLTPILRSGAHPRLVPVATTAFARVVAEAQRAAQDSADLPDYRDRPTTLVLGQHFDGRGAVGFAEETRLYARLIDAAVEQGAERIVFKPHPLSTPARVEALTHAVATDHAEFTVLADAIPSEAIASTSAIEAIASCYSTGLMTAQRLYGVPALSVGCDELLRQIVPFRASDRIPITIIDALTRPDSPYREPMRLQGLLESVAYCMHPGALPDLHDTAVAFLGALTDAERRRYVSHVHTGILDLPALPRSKSLRGVLRRMRTGVKRRP
jgi:hypothetical protein